MDQGKNNNSQGGAPKGTPKQQLVDRLKGASNILVTVRNNPTVDQLSACIGLTIMLNKLDKHATAVFSGSVPSTIEFLKPEDTLEKNTDSLRDFIIALDKSKADKLRYKVEDKIVKIFITPYKTSITDKDLDFSQGDFNVDAVVALGAHAQTDLDVAITSHGRILHDATVMSINNSPSGNLGSINWEAISASSLSEMVAELADDFDKKVLDEQIATALLTGIVAETERFSNERTTPETMTISSELMAAGANQQLVAKQLEPAEIPEEGSNKQADIPHDDAPAPPKAEDGTLEIDHDAAAKPPQDQPAEQTKAPEPPAAPPKEDKKEEPEVKLPEPVSQPPAQPTPELPSLIAPNNDAGNDLPPLPPPPELPHIRQLHDEPRLPSAPQPLSANTGEGDNLGFMSQPPEMGGMLTANTEPEDEEGSGDPFSMAAQEPDKPLLHRDGPDHHELSATPPAPAPVVAPPDSPFQQPHEVGPTLSDIEQSVHSPHVSQAAEQPAEDGVADVDSARDEVLKALNQGPADPLEPIVALNAQPLGQELHDDATAMPQVQVDQDGNLQLPAAPPAPPAAPVLPAPGINPAEMAPGALSPADQPLTMPLPPASSFNLPPAQTTPPTNSPQPAADAPPPVPPPLMPPQP